MERENYSALKRHTIVNEYQNMENPSHNLNDQNVNTLNITPDPVINVLQNTRVNPFNVTKESQTLHSRANLTELTKEFNDLTCKMKHLKEALKNPATGSGKKLYPTLTNSSCQALQVKNFQDIFTVKRFIRDCILNLTLIDHFLDGNDATTGKYRKKLQNALTKEGVTGNNVAIQKFATAVDTFELNSHGTNLMAQVAVGTPEEFWKQDKMEAEVQTELVATKTNETSINKN